MKNLKTKCMMLAVVPVVMLFTSADAFGQSSSKEKKPMLKSVYQKQMTKKTTTGISERKNISTEELELQKKKLERKKLEKKKGRIINKKEGRGAAMKSSPNVSVTDKPFLVKDGVGVSLSNKVKNKNRTLSELPEFQNIETMSSEELSEHLSNVLVDPTVTKEARDYAYALLNKMN